MQFEYLSVSRSNGCATDEVRSPYTLNHIKQKGSDVSKIIVAQGNLLPVVWHFWFVDKVLQAIFSNYSAMQ